MRSRIVSVFTDALASAEVPVFDVASRYTELGDALLPLINPVITAKYGLEIASFIVENVSVPPEVEQAIDKRSSMAAVGNLNDYVKFQMAQGMEKGGGSGGAATELAVGLSIAQQIMQQQGMPGAAAASAATTAVALPDLLSPADAAKALGVAESDVMSIIESGELAGEEDRVRRIASSAALSTTISPSRTVPWPISPPSTSTRARHVARRRSGIPRNSCSSVRSAGARRPFSIDAATLKVEELDLAKALREIPDRGSRLAGREADRAVPELQGRLGLRSRSRGPELRLLRLAVARRLQRDQGADPAAEPPAVHGHRSQRSRANPQVVCEQVARSWQVEEPGARRSGPRRLHPVLDVRRPGRVSVGCRGRSLLLHD